MRTLGTALAAIGFTAFAASAVAPLVAARVGGRTSRTEQSAPLGPTASVDVVIPAYLEAGVIGEKIAQLREAFASYEGPSRIIVVASDAGTAQASSDADLVLEMERGGKAAASNAGVELSTAEVVVLTDANCDIQPASWPLTMIDELNSFDLLSANKGEQGGAEGLFWAYERAIKRRSSAGTLAVVGEFLATRRAHYRPVSTGAILDDFELAVEYDRRGLRVGVSQVIRTTEPAATPREQWERRVRIAEGHYADTIPKLGRLIATDLGRRFAVHKIYRVTLGCAGYWMCVLGVMLALPILSPAIVAGLCYTFFAYRGDVRSPRVLRPVIAIAGMQFVSPAALARSIRRRRKRAESSPSSAALWSKVAR